MEKHVKERLIGAAVLVAAAIILVPEMLSGPGKPGGTPAAPISESIKTYSVDLKSGTAPVAPPIEPSEETPPAEPPAAPAEQAEAVKPESSESTAVAESSTPTAPLPVAEAPPEAKPVPKAAPKPSPVSAVKERFSGSGWAVQVGSFSTQAKAASVAHDFEKLGFSTFVRPTSVNGKNMYRVRVGPMAERAAAEAVLAKVKAHSPGASIVPQ